VCVCCLDSDLVIQENKPQDRGYSESNPACVYVAEKVRFHGSSAGPEGGYGHLTARLAGGRTAGPASIPAAVDPLATTCRLLGDYPTVKHNARVIRYQVPCRNNQQADQIRFICLCPMSCTFRIAVVQKIQSFLA
jgi:hypothetical protein